MRSSFTDIFIKHPVLAIVVTVLTVLGSTSSETASGNHSIPSSGDAEPSPVLAGEVTV